MMQRLVEGAFIGHWLDDIIDQHIRKQNKKREEEAFKGEEDKKIIEVNI